MSATTPTSRHHSPYRGKLGISRRGRKLMISDDPRTLLALPSEVPEKTWSEIVQKEDYDQFFFEIREDIIEDALSVIHDRYMNRQVAPFVVHCTAQAWIKLIDWHFYRHDPGEETSAKPLCYIPKREESWVPDEMPKPSPKDTWGQQDLTVLEECAIDENPMVVADDISLQSSAAEDIPKTYWFPGKVCLYKDKDGNRCTQEEYNLQLIQTAELAPVSVVVETKENKDTVYDDSGTTGSSESLAGFESEILQKITDYTTDDVIKGGTKHGTPVDGSVHGAGDSTVGMQRLRKKSSRLKTLPARTMRSKHLLPPVNSDACSRVSIISDCHLRSLRLDTHFEVSAERVDTPAGSSSKRRQ